MPRRTWPSSTTRSARLDDLGNPTDAVAPDIFKQRRVELGYQFAGERLGFEVRPFYQRISYVDARWPRTRRPAAVSPHVSYKLRPRMTLSLTAAQEYRTFEDPSRRDRDFTVSIALENQFTRHWIAQLPIAEARAQQLRNRPGL